MNGIYNPRQPTLFKASAGEETTEQPTEINALQLEINILRQELEREKQNTKFKMAAGFFSGIAAALIVIFLLKLLKEKKIENQQMEV